MKKAISFLAIFLSILSLHAQEADKNPSRFSLLSFGGIGFGVVENDREPNYNLNTNNGILLLNYRFMKNLGVATGIGYHNLYGNGFNIAGNFYHKRDLLQIPLLLTADAGISEKFRFLLNLGPYANYILKDEFRYLYYTEKNVYSGWNYGFQLGFGFFFKLDDHFSVGLNYSGQSDFTKNSSDTGPAAISDKQKIRNLNSMGISFILDF